MRPSPQQPTLHPHKLWLAVVLVFLAWVGVGFGLARLFSPELQVQMLAIQGNGQDIWVLASERMQTYGLSLLAVMVLALSPWRALVLLVVGFRGVGVGLLLGSERLVSLVALLIGPQTLLMLFAYAFICYKALTLQRDSNFFDYVLSCLLVLVAIAMLVAYELLVLANLDIFTQIG